MRLSLRSILLMLVVAGVPLALSGWNAIRLSREALRVRAQEMHATTAELLASRVAEDVRARLLAVKLAAAAHPFAALSAEERLGALRLAFRQLDGASIIALLTSDGTQAAPPVYLSTPSATDGLGGRLAVGAGDVEAFAAAIPFSAARDVGAAIGPAHTVAGVLHFALAVRTEQGMVLAASISLEPLMELMRQTGLGERGRAYVVDDRGRVLLSRDPAAAREERGEWEAVAGALRGEHGPLWHDDPEHGSSLGASAAVRGLGWSVLVSEPVAEAVAAADVLTTQLLAWLGVAALAALGLGLLLGRAVVRPVQALHRGAQQLQEGNLGFRVEGVDRADELGDLARAFNAMAAEIERWNSELEERVHAKTNEARKVQDMLLRAQKLAAVGQLGAGIAHEVNNPLAGILGLTQLLLAKQKPDTKEHNMLAAVEAEAHRIREIVSNLRLLSSDEDGVVLQATHVHEAVDGALSLVESRLTDEHIEVVREFGEVPPVYGDISRLIEAFLQIIDNARRVMVDGGTLTITSRTLTNKLVQVSFTDTGPGVPEGLEERIFEPFFTTKQDWDAKGLGLTVTNRIIEAHHGTISAENAPGGGATFLVTLPVYQERTLV